MLPARTAPQPFARQIDLLFQFSLLGLVAIACCALASSGYLDRRALLFTFAGITIRAANVTGIMQFRLSQRMVSVAVTACIVLIPIDFYYISHNAAIVHGTCLLTVIKVLTAQTDRDYLYIGAISLLALIAAALLSAQPAFFVWLTLYIVVGIAVFTSAEVRRGLKFHAQQAVPANSRLIWRLAALACAATAGILFTTVFIFLLVPRTARTAARFLPNAPRLTGFSNRIDLGGLGKIARDNRAVMHVSSTARPLPPDLKWRGAALSQFNGRSWFEPDRHLRLIQAAPSPAVLADRSQLSRRDGHRLIYHVDVRNADTGTLFIAGIPEFINIDVPSLYVNRESAVRVPPGFRETLRYDVSAHFGTALPQALTGSERARYLQFPPLDSRIPDLARQWSGTGTSLERAHAIERHLQHDFKYKLDGPQQAVSDPLADFLFVRKEGYCEYFASAMAIMLRSIGIPSRVVTGFQSGYFNDVSGLTVVRASDAHAWVEAWLPASPESSAAQPESLFDNKSGAWVTFDPTPPASSTPPELSRIEMIFDALDNGWRDWVISYDLSHQVLMAAKLEDSLRHLRQPGHHSGNWAWLPEILAASAALLFFGPPLARRLRSRARFRQIGRTGGSPSDATVVYKQMIRRLARQGVYKPASATPNEFAASLRTAPELAAFTNLYNSIRFGGNVSETPRLVHFLKDFKP